MYDTLKLWHMIVSHCESEGCSQQAALEDLLTDLRTIAKVNLLEFELAVDVSKAVFEGEEETHKIIDHYSGNCPECDKPIPMDVAEGDMCSECGFEFKMP